MSIRVHMEKEVIFSLVTSITWRHFKFLFLQYVIKSVRQLEHLGHLSAFPIDQNVLLVSPWLQQVHTVYPQKKKQVHTVLLHNQLLNLAFQYLS